MINKIINIIKKYSSGGTISINPENKGKFTKYCNGKVTQECIDKGKFSSKEYIRKRAIFAENSKKWKK